MMAITKNAHSTIRYRPSNTIGLKEWVRHGDALFAAGYPDAAREAYGRGNRPQAVERARSRRAEFVECCAYPTRRDDQLSELSLNRCQPCCHAFSD